MIGYIGYSLTKSEIKMQKSLWMKESSHKKEVVMICVNTISVWSKTDLNNSTSLSLQKTLFGDFNYTEV